MTRKEVLAYIGSFSRGGKPVKDLSRIAGLMKRLGDPQKRLKFIHIAGTNGKGSVAEYLTNILMESGLRTGTFTSPYILQFEDRIRINRQNIPEDALGRACEQVRGAIAKQEDFSQFEITFAVAMLYFLKAQAEIVVLETGMGGLLDCTNVIDPPLCSVITSVSYDHMSVLGDTIEKIAAQKAGIIKPGSPVVFCPYGKGGITGIFMEKAHALGCDFHYSEFSGNTEMLSCTLAGNRFKFRGTEYTTRMGGNHQIHNAETAIITAEVLREQGIAIPPEAIQKGLAETQVPGRMQILRQDPLVILDGCHNADGIDTLCYTLSRENLRRSLNREKPLFPCAFIVGMTHADAVASAAAQISGNAAQVFCVDGFTDHALPAQTIADAFSVEMTEDTIRTVPLEEALPTALDWAKQERGSIVICGSLYLASWFLSREQEG